jgi:hypothetical protein
VIGDMYYFAVFKRRFSKLKANAKRKEEIIMEQKKKVYTVEEVRGIPTVVLSCNKAEIPL